jgi:hypothetical protein
MARPYDDAVTTARACEPGGMATNYVQFVIETRDGGPDEWWATPAAGTDLDASTWAGALQQLEADGFRIHSIVPLRDGELYVLFERAS